MPFAAEVSPPEGTLLWVLTEARSPIQIKLEILTPAYRELKGQKANPRSFG